MELHNLYFTPSIIIIIKSRRMKWAENVARMEENKNAYRIPVGKPERSLGRPRNGWEGKSRMDFREMGWGVMDWIDLAQYRDLWRAPVNTVMNLRVPKIWGNS
jgi:hypothetical protein